MIVFNDISVRVAGRLLIDLASVNLPETSKIGLIGRNGTGKSTLFRVLTGELSLETGNVSIPSSLHIGQVAQEAPSSEKSLIEIVLEADEERNELLIEAETANDPMRIAEIHTRLADKDAYAAPARASSILHGLGFNTQAQQMPASHFSGGWRMRVALAAMLFAEPELLLLDEPTNYLDIEGVVWLTDYIRNYPHQAIIISHDKDLLNNAVDSILHLDQKKLYYWQGNYNSFAKQRAEKMVLQKKQATKIEAKRQHLESFVERFRAKATKAKQAQSRLKMLEKMDDVTIWQDEHVEPFRFPVAEKPVASPIIHLSDIELGYEESKPILQNLNLRIDKDDRIALLGANGNGKSTFAKFLAGRMKQLSGNAVFAPNLKISFFAQHQMDDLYPEETPIEHFRRLLPLEQEAKLRARVARTGLSKEKMLTKAKNLSGGEKARLLMGIAVLDAPHLLILDEPTNHLDMDSRDELVEALNLFEGAVILIAHDRHLIESTIDRLWQVSDGTISKYEGDMESYAKNWIAKTKQQNKSKNATQNTLESKRKAQNNRKSQALKREQTAPLRKKIKLVEANIKDLELKIKKLDIELSKPEFYQKTADIITKKTTQHAQFKKELDEAEIKWLDLHDELEKLS